MLCVVYHQLAPQVLTFDYDTGPNQAVTNRVVVCNGYKNWSQAGAFALSSSSSIFSLHFDVSAITRRGRKLLFFSFR